MKQKYKLTSVNGLSPDSYIMIEYDESQPLTKYTKILLHKFMSVLNGYIGANTNLNYHVIPVKNLQIKIPIFVYTNDEKKLKTADLIDKRVNTLINHLENIDWLKHTNMQEQWLIYSLSVSGVDISQNFVLSTMTDGACGYNDLDKMPIKINKPTIYNPKLKRFTYFDGSTITYLSSPYLTDYGVFANLSTTFDEMGMSFNALHLYEHLMTYAWSDLNFEKVKLMNGATWPHALCSIFAITQTLDSMKQFAAAFIKFYLESRDVGFWDREKMSEGLKMETQRTMSETRTERTLSSLCRSDLHAYNFTYNTKIFEYWSMRPFNLLIVGPDSLERLYMNKQTIDQYIRKHMPRKINKPKNIVFKTLPLDILKMKSINQYHVVKASKEEIHDYLLLARSDNKCLFGLDSKIVSEVENLDPYNSILHVFCFGNDLFNEDELKDFANRSIIPFSATFFSETSLNSKFAGDYLIDVNMDDEELLEPLDNRE